MVLAEFVLPLIPSHQFDLSAKPDLPQFFVYIRYVLGWLYENSALTVQTFCNSHNGMGWKNLCRVSVDEVASMLVCRSVFQVLIRTVAAVFRWDIPVVYYSMINGSIILALTKLHYTNNLRERSYTFRLTWSHLQAVTKKTCVYMYIYIYIYIYIINVLKWRDLVYVLKLIYYIKI